MTSNLDRPRPTLVAIGAGGHARVMIHAARRCGWDVRLLIDRPSATSIKQLDEVQVVSIEDGEFLHRHAKHNQSEPVAVFIGKTDSSEARATAFRKIIAAGLSTPNLLDPEATIESHVKMGCGVHVLSGATIAVGSELGNDVLVNHRAVVEHDAVIGDHVHIATGALLCGGVSIGKRCLIGAGAIVLPGRKIAAGSVVGAGSVVIQDVAPDTVVAGNPAKQIRCLSPVQVTHCGVA